MKRGRLPTGPLRSAIQMESTTYTVSRFTSSVNDIGEVERTEQTHDADIYVFDPERSQVQLPHGESFDESLGGLALPSENLQDGDEITYGDTPYELTVTESPSSESVRFLTIDLTRADSA